MFLYLRQQHVDMVAAVLLPVLKNGFTLVKEQQCVMNLGLPASVSHSAEPQCESPGKAFCILLSPRQIEM